MTTRRSARPPRGSRVLEPVVAEVVDAADAHPLATSATVRPVRTATWTQPARGRGRERPERAAGGGAIRAAAGSREPTRACRRSRRRPGAGRHRREPVERGRDRAGWGARRGTRHGATSTPGRIDCSPWPRAGAMPPAAPAALIPRPTGSGPGARRRPRRRPSSRPRRGPSGRWRGADPRSPRASPRTDVTVGQ